MTDDTNKSEAPENIDPKDVAGEFEKAEQWAAKLQDTHSQEAQHAGYTRDVVHVTGPFYVRLAEMAEDMPSLLPVVISGMRVVKAMSAELEEAYKKAALLLPGLAGISSSAYTFMTTAGTASAMIIPDNTVIPPPTAPPFYKPDQAAYVAKLTVIEPALADTYRGIGEAYHGTISDRGRAALALMREFFNHLLVVLAPDDHVRGSPYWKPKEGGKPDQVTRRERLKYAAHTHIPDKARAKTVTENFDNALTAYDVLNDLHKRGDLSESQVRSALATMQRFVEDFLDAMSAPGD